jgi:acyl-CoA synthetase (AMP-forming)/AMP-acid ligase II
MVSQRSIARCMQLIPLAYRLMPHSRCAYTGTFSFVSGLWGIHLPHLYLGGRIDLLHPYTIDEWVDHVARERSTFTNVSVPLVAGLLDRLDRDPTLFDSVVSVMHAGSPMPRPRLEALIAHLGDRFIEVWGMTETCAPVTASAPGDWTRAAADPLASVGRPLPTASVRVVDDAGQVLAPGEAGELEVEADTMFSGYLDRPDATVAAFDGRWYRTGDVGTIDAHGYVSITGRASELIITGGMNVFPVEIESALTALPEVADCAVVGVPDDRYGEAVAAAVVLREGATITPEAVSEHVRRVLAGYKKPRQVEFVEQLPRNASQKLDRQAVRELLVQRRATQEVMR